MKCTTSVLIINDEFKCPQGAFLSLIEVFMTGAFLFCSGFTYNNFHVSPLDPRKYKS